MFAWKYKDDRGKPVSLEMSSSVNWKRHREHKELLRNGLITPSREQKKAWRRASVRYMGLAVASSVVGLAVCWLVWYLVIDRTAGGKFMDDLARNLSVRNTRWSFILIMMMAWVAATAAPSLIAMRFWARIFGEPWVRRRLLLRRCPSCDFSLVNLPVDQDMCTRCTECNAAWRIPAGAITTDANKNHL
jgi:hypothetical protein